MDPLITPSLCCKWRSSMDWSRSICISFWMAAVRSRAAFRFCSAIWNSHMETIGIGKVVTAMGRGIALDRDGNYAKIQRAFDALVFGKGRPYVID